MREQDRYEVFTEEEREELEAKWAAEIEFFKDLKVKHLVSRHIHGKIARFYDIRVGLDESGNVDRHYYPLHDKGELIGAECRNLPKDFRYGHLGWKWGSRDLFGMHTLREVMDSGRRMDTVVVTGAHWTRRQHSRCSSKARRGRSGKASSPRLVCG